jgi:hypothetical protein
MLVEGLHRQAVSNKQTLVIIHGAARGADLIAGEIALSIEGVKVEEYPAQWEKHGKKAGPLRNVQMLQEGQPELVIAFHDDLANSKGTRHMATIAAKQGLDVYVVRRYSGG